MKKVFLLFILLSVFSSVCFAGHQNDPLIYDDHDLNFSRLQLNEFKTIKHQGKYYIHVHVKSYARDGEFFGIPTTTSLTNDSNFVYNPNTNKVRKYIPEEEYITPNKNDETEHSKWMADNIDAKHGISFMEKVHPDILNNTIKEVDTKNKEIGVSLPTLESESNSVQNSDNNDAMAKKTSDEFSTLSQEDVEKISKVYTHEFQAYDMGKDFIPSEEFNQRVKDSFGMTIQEITQHPWIVKNRFNDNNVLQSLVAIVPMHMTIRNTGEQYDTLVFVTLGVSIGSFSRNNTELSLSNYDYNKEIYPSEYLFISGDNTITTIQPNGDKFDWQSVKNNGNSQYDTSLAATITQDDNIAYFSITNKSISSSTGAAVLTLEDTSYRKYKSYLMNIPSINLPPY